MGDLGMHVLHVPLRLGWKPNRLHAQLQKIITERPDGKGGMAICDTWNNAVLNTTVAIGAEEVPMTLEMKRIAPGETNTWYIEVLGTQGGVKYSTKDTKALWTFKCEKEQVWQRTDLGFKGMPFQTITGGIFEPGFPDCFMQMLAAYVAERAGALNGRFGCVTPQEALDSHYVFNASLKSFANQTVENVHYYQAQPV
jgi:predicted dehydrogenase